MKTDNFPISKDSRSGTRDRDQLPGRSDRGPFALDRVFSDHVILDRIFQSEFILEWVSF